jgi:hypothetical protein
VKRSKRSDGKERRRKFFETVLQPLFIPTASPHNL